MASNGQEALSALHRQSYDVVFMDVQMPEMDGLEATRQICKQWQRESRPWIITMTAHAMTGDHEQCLAAGMNDYVSKPIRVEALVQVLDNYRQLRQPLSATTENTENIDATTVVNQAVSDITSDSAATPVIDIEVLQALKDMAGEDTAIIAEIIDSYLEEAPSRLQAINAAVANADAVALRSSTHAFRSLSVTVGAIAVAQICETLETMGRNGTTVGAATLL